MFQMPVPIDFLFTGSLQVLRVATPIPTADHEVLCANANQPEMHIYTHAQITVAPDFSLWSSFKILCT